MSKEYQICTRCVMDTSDPAISFDADGVCNHCHRADRLLKKTVIPGKKGEKFFDDIIKKIKKEGQGKEYDCILGISGGVDSSYLACKVVEAGLHPLAVHFDSGWNSELAVNNITQLVNGLGLDLFTVVCDWREMSDLQRSFFRASLVNCDTPQDHAFIAVLWRLAKKNKIRFIFSGHNTNTESVLPKSYLGYSSRDWKLINCVQKRFGDVSLKKYPHVGFLKQLYYKYGSGFEVIKALNYLDYNKDDAIDYLKENYGWAEYSGKHGESILTRFFQGYYLPEKFGIDKRRAHLSALVISKQMSREGALEELSEGFYSDDSQLQSDKEFVLKKIRLGNDEWDDIMKQGRKDQHDYSSDDWLYRIEDKVVGGASSMIKKLLPTSMVARIREGFSRKFKT